MHCMLDLETMGTRPGCAIAQIGAIGFDPVMGDMAEKGFFIAIKLYSNKKFGLTCDPDTVEWWLRQGEDARLGVASGAEYLDSALQKFTQWYKQNQFETIWSHGATFDIPILDAAYEAAGQQAPWRFWDARDTRTILGLANVEIDKTKGVIHNALDDAKNQVEAVLKAYSKIEVRA